jgi:hypothetical protein
LERRTLERRSTAPSSLVLRSARSIPHFRVVAGLYGIVLGLLALHLYVYQFPPTPTPMPVPADPESAWWGLWPITAAPAWAVYSGAIVVVMSILITGWWLSRSPAANPSPNTSPHPVSRILYPLFCLLLLLAFFRFPIAHTRWGDAYLIAKAVAWPDPALRLTHSWQAPLDLWLHSQVWLHGSGWFGWGDDATPVYRLLSPLAGAIYLAVVLALSRWADWASALVTVGLLTTLGVLQLFFGYIENYSFAAAGILAYLWLGLAVLAGRRPLWQAATILALTHALHPSTLILAPSLLYLGWQEAQSRRQRNKSLWPVVLWIGAPMLVIGGATFLLMELGGHGLTALLTTDRPGGGDARPFVPLWTISTRWEHYTMFSWLHLRDLLNQQLLVAPVVWPSLVWIFWIGRRGIVEDQGDLWRLGKISQSPQISTNLQSPSRFLAIAALAYLLFICVWNPDYGGQRDWDLFSLAALPATLWLALLLPRVLPEWRALLAGATPLLLLQGLHTLAWIYQNTLPWEWP